MTGTVPKGFQQLIVLTGKINIEKKAPVILLTDAHQAGY